MFMFKAMLRITGCILMCGLVLLIIRYLINIHTMTKDAKKMVFFENDVFLEMTKNKYLKNFTKIRPFYRALAYGRGALGW